MIYGPGIEVGGHESLLGLCWTCPLAYMQGGKRLSIIGQGDCDCGCGCGWKMSHG
jgi:hypothetical protein